MIEYKSNIFPQISNICVMASKETNPVPTEVELRQKLDEQRQVLENLIQGSGWAFYKNGETYVAEKALEDPKDGTIEFKFVARYISTKGEGVDVRKQVADVMWEGRFEDADEDIEEKKFIYTNPDKNIQVKYLREKFPWPCQRRDYVTAMAREETETSSVVWGVPVDYGVEVSSKVTRGSESFLCIIENMEGIISKCRMTAIYRFNAGGSIPAFVVKMGITDMLDTMVDIQKLV